MEKPIVINKASVRFPVRGGLLRRPVRFVQAVDDVSLEIRQNETVALVGESGSGKTTLGMTLLGLQRLSEGEIRWRGQAIETLSAERKRAFRKDVQIIFQDPYGSLNPRLTIAETLLRPLRVHNICPPGQRLERVEAMLGMVGLSPAKQYLNRYPHEFSGGQRQRIAIARALIIEPSIVVADEPVSALDVSIRAQILELLARLKRELGLSMLFLSHDLGVVRFIADRVAVMYLGKLVEIGDVASVFENPRHPYTRLLLQSAPSIGRRAELEEYDLNIEPPNPTAPPSGCRFRTRCPRAMPICAEVAPRQAKFAGDHSAWCHLHADAAASNDQLSPGTEPVR